MFGKTRIVLIVLILAGGGILLGPLLSAPSRFLPYPYRFQDFPVEGMEEAARSEVLIVGDRMGERLSFYTAPLQREWKVYNWSREGEGLHRVLHKLRQLPSLPPVVIYHGGVDEFYEKRFHPRRDYRRIREDLLIHRRYRDTIWAHEFPRLASYWLFSRSSLWLGPRPLFNAESYEPREKQRQMELTYHLLRLEFRELASLFEGTSSVLLMVTPPLNLSVAPGQVCANASTRLIVARQKKLAELVEGGADGAVGIADQLAQDSPGNAQSFYLRGQAYQRAGRIQEAKASLYRASIYDCDTSQGNIIVNKIMVGEGEKENLTIINFNSMVNNNFGEEGLFVDNYFPRKAYYEQLMDILEREIGKALEKN